MAGEVEDEHEIRGVNTSMDYLQRSLQATLTIWLSLAVVIIAAFGLSETLRVAGGESNANLLIPFIFSLGLIFLVLLLLPRSFLTLKEANKDDIRQRYIQQVLLSLSVTWAILALIIIAAMSLYSVLRVAGGESNANLLIAFILSIMLILLALWLVPKSFLTLKDEENRHPLK